MRILIISDHADPLAEVGSKEAGGQNIYILYLAKYLCRLGIYVDVYTRWDKNNKREIVNLNNHLRVIRIKAGPKRYIPRDTFLQVIDEFSDNVCKRVKREKMRYDIIHANYWFSGVIGLKIAKKMKIPMVFVFHSIGQVRFETLKKYQLQKDDYILFQTRKLWENTIVHKTDKIIATSPVEKQIIKKIFNISEEKIKCIPIGVDQDIFYPVPFLKARRSVRVPEKGKLILYVGRIEWRKGIGTLLYAFKEILKKYPEAMLYVIGGGKSKSAQKLEQPETDRLKNMIKDLELQKNVIFRGPRSQKRLAYYYSAADVCVVPSYYEPFGIVPLEAMACGTPVVASKTGGLKFTVVPEKTGYLAEPRNYQDLAEKIELVLKKEKDYFQENCLNRIRDNFVWEKIAGQYIKYFNELVKKCQELKNKKIIQKL